MTWNIHPVNMPGPIRKRFYYGHLWPLRPACSQNRAGSHNYARSGFPHPFFQRRHGSYCAKPTRIWSGWPWPGSDLDGLVRVWQNTSSLEASQRCAGIIWPGFWQNATGPLPVSHFQTRFYSSTDVRDNIARIRFSSGRLCQVLAKRIRSGTKPVSKNHPAPFWPMLPSRSGPDANRIRHVYWLNMVPNVHRNHKAY